MRIIEKVLAGQRTCSKPGAKCEDCPYCAAGESCTEVLAADTIRMLEGASEMYDWLRAFLAAVVVENADTLLTMAENLPALIREEEASHAEDR